MINPNLARLRWHLAAAGGRLYIGAAPSGLVLADPQHAALVLGPPRSGKTSAVAVPNVLCAPGPLIVTSTKTDLLAATIAARAEVGRCWLLDPEGRWAGSTG
jgi:type IV secretory pathway TraG/TraD family ATPase VirD4